MVQVSFSDAPLISIQTQRLASFPVKLHKAYMVKTCLLQAKRLSTSSRTNFD